jgi:proteic killer suppression protein
MIRSFRNRGLRTFWERSEIERIPTDWATKTALILDLLDAATKPQDLVIPGLRFHVFEEDNEPRYGVMVSNAWRLSFAWSRGDAIDVDLEEVA